MPAALRIFVSSTFRDFDRERDVLRRLEGELRDRLRPRGSTVTLVDLRWGIFTEADTEAEREQEILRVCLDEVDRTRPLFLGLIGSRYGWVPDVALARAAAARAGLPAPDGIGARSVTELEILHGALGPDGDASRSAFLVRRFDPAPPDGYADPPRSRAAQQLADLEQQIRSSGAAVVDYEVPVDPEGNQDLRAFETAARRVLEALVDAEIGEAPPPAEALQAAYAAERLVAFHGRQQVVEELQRPLHAPGSLVVLEAPAGSGKSAVAAAVAAVDRPDTISLFHCFGLGPHASLPTLLDRIERRLVPSHPEGDRPATDLPVEQRVARLIEIGDRQRRAVVLCLDALDECALPTERLLRWLPDPLPDWLHVLATTRTWSRRGHPAAQVRSLPPLDEAARSDIVRSRFAERSKEVPARVIDLLVRPGTDGAAPSPLWLVLASELLSGLDVFDFASLAARPGAAEARVQDLVITTAADLPDGTEALYRTLLERARRAVEPRLVDAVTTAIACSRAGVPAAELGPVASELAGVEVSALDVARVRGVLGSQLIEQGALGEVDVGHAQLRSEVLGPGGAGAAGWQRAHEAIARALVRPPETTSPFAHREAPWHLLAAGQEPGFAAWLRADEHGRRTAAGDALAEHILADPEAAPATMGQLTSTGFDPATARVLGDVLGHLDRRAPVVVRRAVTEAWHQALVPSAGDPARPQERYLLACVRSNLGDLALAGDDLDTAGSWYRSARDDLESTQVSEGADAVLDTLIVLSTKLAQLAQHQGDPDALHEHAAHVASLVDDGPPHEETAARSRRLHHRTGAHLLLGEAALAHGRSDDAVRELELALASATERVTIDPDSTEARRDRLGVRGGLADAWHRQGRPDRAQQEYRSLTAELTDAVAKAPDDDEIWADLALVQAREAELLHTLGHTDAAMERTSGALEIYDRLLAADPGHALLRDQREAAASLLRHHPRGGSPGPPAPTAARQPTDPGRSAAGRHNLAVDLIDQAIAAIGGHRLDDAASLLDQADRHLGSLSSAGPEITRWRGLAGSAAAARGALAEAEGRVDEAATWYERSAEAAARSWTDEPGVPAWGQDLSYALDRLGRLHLDAGDPDVALSIFERAASVDRDLELRFPDRVDLRRSRRTGLGRIATTALQSGDLDRAQTVGEQVLASFDLDHARHPAPADLDEWNAALLTLDRVHHQRAALAAGTGDLLAAVAALEAAVHIDDLLIARAPDDAMPDRERAGTHQQLARVLAIGGRTIEARVVAADARRFLDRLVQLGSDTADTREIDGALAEVEAALGPPPAGTTP